MRYYLPRPILFHQPSVHCMKKVLRNIFYFLPVQLLFLHFRKYQLLLVFWLILLFTILGKFAVHFGASSLFLAPEYLGNISFASMFLLGSALCVFIMMWNITTFLIHSKRIPFLGATRHAFLVYCINNLIIPVAFVTTYVFIFTHYQMQDEHDGSAHISLLLGGFFLGLLVVGLVSFAYFFRVSRDFFKSLLTTIANPSRIREIIPYDSLDYEIDIIPARSFLSGSFHIRHSSDQEPYPPRVMNTILQRHHRNVVFATFICFLVLLLLGIFIDQPLVRVPAGASFLLLFSILMGVVGAFKYFLKSWETLGWVLLTMLLSLMVQLKWFDLRSIAYGLNYHQQDTLQPSYTYDHLKEVFSAQRFDADRKTEEGRLDKWKAHLADSSQPTAVVISVSGGGSRSAYWTFRSLQYLDSVSHGELFRHTVLITGASGGMLGAAYWRSIHDACQLGSLKDPYAARYQQNIGKDILNSIIFSLACVDLISPFNKISISGYSYTRDRGFAMEEEVVRNTEGLLGQNFGYYRPREAAGIIPQLIVNGTIVNDGRKLMMTAQPAGYLTQPEYSLTDSMRPIDAIDFATFFARQNPYNMRLISALRMNATFPFVLPVVRLPSKPYMNVMDAGMRDNFGTEVAGRYLFALRDWLTKNTGNVVFLEIRDTRECEVAHASNQSSFGQMLVEPLFVIQNKWEAFQSYSHCFVKDYSPYFMSGKMRYVTMQYVPQESKKVAALNFHLTQKEKEDLYSSIYYPENLAEADTLLRLLK